jgi:hypothetical protein
MEVLLAPNDWAFSLLFGKNRAISLFMGKGTPVSLPLFLYPAFLFFLFPGSAIQHAFFAMTGCLHHRSFGSLGHRDKGRLADQAIREMSGSKEQAQWVSLIDQSLRGLES